MSGEKIWYFIYLPKKKCDDRPCNQILVIFKTGVLFNGTPSSKTDWHKNGWEVHMLNVPSTTVKICLKCIFFWIDDHCTTNYIPNLTTNKNIHFVTCEWHKIDYIALCLKLILLQNKCICHSKETSFHWISGKRYKIIHSSKSRTQISTKNYGQALHWQLHSPLTKGTNRIPLVDTLNSNNVGRYYFQTNQTSENSIVRSLL